MPSRITVIGAGVVGLSCASELQRRGHAVTVIDPSPPGSACSFGNAGCLSRGSFLPLGLPGMWRKVPGWLRDRSGPLSIRLRYAHRVAPWLWRLHRCTSFARVNQIADALFPLVDKSVERWRSLAEWAGVPQLIRQQGYAFAYESEAAFVADTLGRNLRRARGVEIVVLKGPEILEFEPALSPAVTHLAFMPQQGHVTDPGRLSQALADRLRAGGSNFEQAAARGFEFCDGRVARVVTDGGCVEVDAAILAAGAHSRELAAKLGSRVPLETERGYHAMLIAPTVSPRIPLCSGEGKFFVTPMDRGLRVAGTVELAGLQAPPDYRRVDTLVAGAKRLIPSLGYASVDRWMGHRPSLPDSMPVLGRSPCVANAYFAFGHGHVGLTAAAPTAEIIADLLEDRVPYMDIAPFAARRFERERAWQPASIGQPLSPYERAR